MEPVASPEAATEPLARVWEQSLNWLQAGGPIMAILFGLSVLALTLIFLKLLQFASLRIGARAFIDEALGYWTTLRPEPALQTLAATSNPIARVLETAMRGLNDPKLAAEVVREDVLRVAAAQNQALNRYFRGLDAIATLAPLLGLLGTVLGMINAFQALEAAGGRADPAQLAGGIWEALLTTAFGLAVAIPTAAALHGLESVAERTRHAMEDAVTRVFTRSVEIVALAPPPSADAPQPLSHAP
ncbi:MAG: MotA/TolQ/ExbB proton channel family protein [Candidatus Competibacteraceae bacterium]|nr:MAG: MotA/TolQ/ExbB proton channel family protein [Candidatus Competibacteraceae bacterium]